MKPAIKKEREPKVSKHFKAGRTSHTCNECGEVIKPGEKVSFRSGKPFHQDCLIDSELQAKEDYNLSLKFAPNVD